MVEVRCDACLHDACHMAYRSKAAGASCEERQDGKAPPLPIQPGNNAGHKCLSCGDPNSVQQGQSVAEQAAERHVPPLQPGLCGGKKKQQWLQAELGHAAEPVGEGDSTWRIERDHPLQQRLQLSLQINEAYVAFLLQSHQSPDTPAHIRSSLRSLFLPKAA